MKILIETIPHDCQRYSTASDWAFEADGSLLINISEIIVDKQEQKDSEFLLGLHTMIQAYLCRKVGVTPDQIFEFNSKYNGIFSEPELDPRSPYFLQHLVATTITMMVAAHLKVNINEHTKNIASLK